MTTRWRLESDTVATSSGEDTCNLVETRDCRPYIARKRQTQNHITNTERHIPTSRVASCIPVAVEPPFDDLLGEHVRERQQIHRSHVEFLHLHLCITYVPVLLLM